MAMAMVKVIVVLMATDVVAGSVFAPSVGTGTPPWPRLAQDAGEVQEVLASTSVASIAVGLRGVLSWLPHQGRREAYRSLLTGLVKLEQGHSLGREGGGEGSSLRSLAFAVGSDLAPSARGCLVKRIVETFVVLMATGVVAVSVFAPSVGTGTPPWPRLAQDAGEVQEVLASTSAASIAVAFGSVLLWLSHRRARDASWCLLTGLVKLEQSVHWRDQEARGSSLRPQSPVA